MEDSPEIEELDSHSREEEIDNYKMSIEISDESIDSIYESLLKGKSGFISSILMRNPIREIRILATTDDGTNFNLAAYIFTNETDFFGKQRGINEVADDIVAQTLVDIDDVQEMGGSYVIPGGDDRNFVLSVDDEQCILSISTGEVIQYEEEIEAGEEPFRLIESSPELTRENLEAHIEDLLNLTVIATNQCYRGIQFRKNYSPVLKVKGLQTLEIGEDYSMAIGNRESLLKKIEMTGKLDLTFEDVGGQREAKEILWLCSLGFKAPEVYERWGTKFPKGILLYGPPGTGKTLMAKVLASSSDSRFFNVRWADIASGWYGESESALKDIFDFASKGGKRTVIFFDEIDSLAPPRNNSYEGSQKVVGTLLSEMDGLKDSGKILVVGATNNIDGVDSALKRAGRFDFMIKFEMPDDNERLEIFNIHIKKAEEYAKRRLFEDINWALVMNHIGKYNGSDIAEVIRRVLEEKVKQELHGGNPNLVSTDDLIATIEKYNLRNEKRNPLGFLSSN